MICHRLPCYFMLTSPRCAYQLRTVCVAGSHQIEIPGTPSSYMSLEFCATSIPCNFIVFLSASYISMLFHISPSYSILYVHTLHMSHATPSCSSQAQLVHAVHVILWFPSSSCSTPSHTMSCDSMPSLAIPCHPTLSDIVKIATVDRSLRKVLTKDLGDPLAHDFGASVALPKRLFWGPLF